MKRNHLITELYVYTYIFMEVLNMLWHYLVWKEFCDDDIGVYLATIKSRDAINRVSRWIISLEPIHVNSA